VCERERDREIKKEREDERERKKEIPVYGGVSVYMFLHAFNSEKNNTLKAEYRAPLCGYWSVSLVSEDRHQSKYLNLYDLQSNPKWIKLSVITKVCTFLIAVRPVFF